MNASEAADGLALSQSSPPCHKVRVVRIKTTWFTQQKFASSLAAIQRPGHYSVQDEEMGPWFAPLLLHFQHQIDGKTRYVVFFRLWQKNA